MKGIIFLTVSALIYTIATTIIFFKKDTINKLENRIFKKLLLITIVSMITELMIVATVDMETIGTIVQKGFLVCLLLWLSVFMLYTFAITIFDDKKSEEENIEEFKIAHYVFVFINVILYILVFLLPIDFVTINEDIKYTTGPAVNVVFVTLGVYTTLMSIMVLMRIKNVHKKGYIPIIALIICLIAEGIIQKMHPEMLLANAVFGFIIYLMYFTIENPDLKMLEQMEIARNQAEKANRAKSDFLSSMSHEIRTPLNAIVGLSEDIGNYENSVPKEVAEDAKDIINASQTLLEIVGNILDINKIESNKLEIVEIKYNPKEIIKEVAKVDCIRIGEKPIDFKIDIAPDIPFELIGDKVHVKQILNNLLSNAIKYTEKGEINLSAKCINQNDICNLIISVQDTGRGIKADNINKLFAKFERLDMERNTTTEGTGLGLAITKQLVEMMGGTINVQSQFGTGSMFVVQIPQKISQMIEPYIYQEESISSNSNVEISQSNNLFTNKRILIVDDNSLNIKVARKALQDFELILDDVMSGQDCLNKVVNGNEYDLILMDIMMPEMSGETTLQKLKENPNFNIPVIALTADAVAGAEEKYKSEGFTDYIAKPFKKEQIKEKLDLIFKLN